MSDLVDRLPAGDRGAVEHLAFGKGVLFDHADVEGHVLPLAARIGEAQVDVFYVVVLDRFQDVFGGLHEYPFWLTGRFPGSSDSDFANDPVRYRERNQAAEAALFLFFSRKIRDSTRLR